MTPSIFIQWEYSMGVVKYSGEYLREYLLLWEGGLFLEA